MERHGEILDELCGQTFLQQRHVGGHIIGQEDEHADVVLHLDLSDLEEENRKWDEGLYSSITGWLVVSPHRDYG